MLRAIDASELIDYDRNDPDYNAIAGRLESGGYCALVQFLFCPSEPSRLRVLYRPAFQAAGQIVNNYSAAIIGAQQFGGRVLEYDPITERWKDHEQVKEV